MDSRTATSAALTPKGFRLDIQGIRGFALILVLACHAEVPHTEGGFVALDVFYVLSGFLITGLILTEIDRTGTVSIRRFYARRARRLLPLAVTVLGVIGIGSLLLFPTPRIHEVSGHVVAAALYFVNWQFMAESVDYFAGEDGSVSPVQHYWSLSIEEQFYVVWPLLVLAATVVALRLGWSRRGVLLALVAPLLGCSLAYSVWFSEVDQQQAYFSTLTRVWQIAAGAVLAIVLPAGLRLARSASAVLVGGGIVVLVASMVAYDVADPYPGWRAAVPVAAAMAVIVGGTATAMSLPVRFLTIEPLQYLGRISYAWYLWHWPVLVFATTAWGDLRIREKVLLTLAAWIPTIVSHHLIEERFRHSSALARRPRRAIAVGLGFSAAAVLIGFTMVALRPGIPTAPESAVAGARTVYIATMQEQAQALRPSPADATGDRGALFDDGCLVKGKRRTSPPCVYGDEGSRRTVVVLGDSHALQYFPAMRRLARKHGWRLVGLTRASCPIGDVDYQPTCNAWRENTLRRIEREERPDLVVTSSSIDKRFRVRAGGRKLSRRASQPLLEAGYARTFRRLLRTGARVAVIRDQPRTPFNVAECVSEHPRRFSRCSFVPRRSTKLSFDLHGARRAGRRVEVIDPLPVLCPQTGRGRGRRCPAVIGNALVYRDSYHLSATYARTLDEWLDRRLPPVR